MIDYEKNELSRLVKEYDLKKVFEIGTYKGGTTIFLSDLCEKVYTIDIKNHMPGFVFPVNVVSLIGDSFKYDFSGFRDCIDLVFIDGCHHRKYVRKDTLNAYRMVRNHGFIVWHDYDICRPDIVRFVNGFSRRHHCKVNHPVGTKLAICRIGDKK